MTKQLAFILPLLMLAGCTKSAPKVEDVAANSIGNDDVTEVPDDSASANSDRDNMVAGAIGNSGTSVVDPD